MYTHLIDVVMSSTDIFFSKMDRCSEVLLQIRATIVVELKQHVATKVRLCAGPTIQACKAEAAKETQTDDNR